MEDEKVMAWRRETAASDLIKKMGKRGFEAVYAPTAEEAKAAVLALVPPQGLVALVGSQTMNQIGVYGALRASGRELVDPAVQGQGLSPEEAHRYRKRVFLAEALLTSANAVDEEGRLYNIDGVGNRVAASIFGPDTVIFAIGLNKVVAGGPEAAWQRARQLASPLNNKRLELANPCVKSGRCHDCQLESSICNYFAVIDRSRPVGRIKVVLIGQDFGY